MEKWLQKKAVKRVAEEIKSISDVEPDEDEVPSKKKKYTIRFRNEWKEKYPWLEQDNKTKQGKKCMVCNVAIYGNLHHIERHAETEMHKKNEFSAKSTINIEKYCKSNCEEDKIVRAAQDLELRLCLFISEHNLPFTALDHLSKIISTIKGSKTVEKVVMHRHKGQNIITNITGPQNCKNISEIANKQFYSVIIDESTDISMNKNLAVIIRIFNRVCQDRFLDFAPVVDSTSTGIFNALIEVLKEHNIPLDNLLGFTADNCNVMMGKRNGVQAKLKEICPKIFINGDICHNLNLCSEAAAAVLPGNVEKLIRHINHHFCHSSSRQEDFAKLQQEFGSPLHSIIKFCSTRWLSRQAVVDRILEQWSALQYYFGLCHFESGFGNENNRFIVDSLSDPLMKMYFYFLSYILKIINDINLEMQAEEARIHVLLPRLTFLFQQICRNFISKEKIDSTMISLIDLNDHISVCEIFCGTESEIISNEQNLSPSDIMEFKNYVLKFYIKFCENLRKRIDFNNEITKFLPAFAPRHVISGKTNSILPLILKLFPKSELKSAELINTEYRALADFPEIKQFENLSISEFWHEISQIKNELKEFMFSNIFRIAQGVLSLPHSSACVERIFSVQNLVKTKCRNKLALKTLAALIQTKDLMRANESCCFNFETANLTKVTQSNNDCNTNNNNNNDETE